MKTDCVMCYQTSTGRYICTALRSLYCADGSPCGFYKSNVYYRKDPATGFIKSNGGVKDGEEGHRDKPATG